MQRLQRGGLGLGEDGAFFPVEVEEEEEGLASSKRTAQTLSSFASVGAKGVATTAKGRPTWVLARSAETGGATMVTLMWRGVQLPVSIETKGLFELGGLRRDVAERVWKLLMVMVAEEESPSSRKGEEASEDCEELWRR